MARSKGKTKLAPAPVAKPDGKKKVAAGMSNGGRGKKGKRGMAGC